MRRNAKCINIQKRGLKHAINEKDSDIIGFHVDIDKYNEFIASEENKQ